MQVIGVRFSASDVRYFAVDPAYRIGHYHETENKGTARERVILAIARVPTGTQPPVGRLTPAQLSALADEGRKEAQPEVLARYPYWSEVLENGHAFEMPDDTPVEPVAPLPPSQVDRSGLYLTPPAAYEPLKPAKPAKGG